MFVHTQKYWKAKGIRFSQEQASVELFAHMFHAFSSNDKTIIREYRKFFPEYVKEFEKIF